MLVKMGKNIYGDPQRSILGTTFFQIFITEIDTHISTHISRNLFIYADDTHVVLKDSQFHQVQILIHKNNKITR